MRRDKRIRRKGDRLVIRAPHTDVDRWHELAARAGQDTLSLVVRDLLNGKFPREAECN